jgi:Tfp pilus assembly PilM family ATPase
MPWRDAFRSSLDKLLTRHDLRTETVCVSLNGNQVLGRFLYLPHTKQKKMDAAVRYEAQHQFAVPLQELVWTYQSLQSLGESAANGDARNIMLVAIKANHALETLSVFEDCKISVSLMQSECLALHNLAVFNWINEPESQPLAVLDVGHKTSSLVVSMTPQKVWFRTIASGAADFSSALVRQLKLTRGDAERLVRDPHTAGCLYELDAALRPVFADLAKQIQLSLSSFRTAYPEVSAEQLHGAGGGFLTHGLLRFLRTGR